MGKFIGLLLLLPLLAQAEYLTVENAWVRAAPPTSQMTAHCRRSEFAERVSVRLIDAFIG